MVLNTLLTGLEPKIDQILHVSNPEDIVSAVTRIERELQLRELYTKTVTDTNNTARIPNLIT